jgi:hypothetical protein
VIVDSDVARWGANVVVEAVPSEGVRNEVAAVRVDDRLAVALRSRRSEASLDWELAANDHDVAAAVARAGQAITRSGWTITATCDAPATGRGGAREAFIHATRAQR